MRNSIPACIVPLIEAWTAPQEELPGVIRWSKYIGNVPGVRRQDTAQHTISITLLAVIVVSVLRRYGGTYGERVVSGVALHDFGEGARQLRNDVHYIDKSEFLDLCEYRAFCSRHESLGPKVFEALNEAFLLQFARKRYENFPYGARSVMERLREEALSDILAFEAIERLDYVLYAIEQYHIRGNDYILLQVLRNQVPSLNELADALPGFREELWTPELSSWAQAFIDVRAGQWIEKKGES